MYLFLFITQIHNGNTQSMQFVNFFFHVLNSSSRSEIGLVELPFIPKTPRLRELELKLEFERVQPLLEEAVYDNQILSRI